LKDGYNASHATVIHLDSRLHVAALIGFTAVISYLAAQLGGVLVIRPEMIWPLWPGCAFLVAVLLLTPHRMWPALLLAGLCGFTVFDMQEHLPIRATGVLLVADSIEILIVALCVRWVFGGVPRLNSVETLAKYSVFALFLGPVAASSLTAQFQEGSFRVTVLTEALALLTFTPAILSWVEIARTRARKPGSYYLQAAAMYLGLGVLAYSTFVESGSGSRPALLYSLVPFLLWAALQFGIAGASNSMVLVSIIAIWGVVHKRGPFISGELVNDVLSLQLFLLVAGGSFMVLAAVVDERKAQKALLESQEELLKCFVKNVPAGVAMFDRDMRYLQVSERWSADHGVDRGHLLGRCHYEVFPDIPERWKEVHRRALDGETLRAEEDPWERESGTVWERWEVRPWKKASGEVGGILIFVENITRRKQMEEALSGMSRTLIESQEQERARIGRELHDDINQRLALLSVELEQLQENPSEIQERVLEVRKGIAEISDDVQALSHDLHSSKLEYLGVVAGIKSWCKEFAGRQKIEIDFKSDVSSVLPIEIGLTLFRVLQEALQNAVKHSGVKKVEVQLREEPREIHLSICDLGRGFDVEVASQGKGLGLTSMRERIRLVNGNILIESKPMGGTRIQVQVPISVVTNSARAAG
jgi:PAS domain S-box-containing protein